MKRLYSTVLSSDDIWEPEFEGTFLHSNLGVYFAYRKRKAIIFSAIEAEKTADKAIMTDGVDLPANWLLVNKGLLLMCSERHCVDLNTLRIVDCVDEKYCEEYDAKSKKRPMHLTVDDFEFGNYTISHDKACGLLCRKEGLPIWKINCRGYLYTEIIPFNENIIFGTAGMGGHLYIIKLSTGEVKCDINTLGTDHFCISDNKIYFLSRRENKLQAVSTDTWQICDEMALDGELSPSSRFALDENKIYVITFRYKKRNPTQAILNVLEK